MPEVMEIRKYANFINNLFAGKKLTDINIIKGRYKKHASFDSYDLLKTALPLSLVNVETKGKFISAKPVYYGKVLETQMPSSLTQLNLLCGKFSILASNDSI